jgi:anaerobic selenocysteine-containing dehydrogenase
LASVSSIFPSTFNLDQLAVGTVSFPIDVGSGNYLLVQINSRTPSQYSAVKGDVAQVVQNKGASKAQAAITSLERHSTVTIDPRYGVWVPLAAQVLVPFTPQTTDVLNPDANTAGSTSASSSPASG